MTREELALNIEPLRRGIEANGAQLADASEKLEARNKLWATALWAPATVGLLIIVINHFWR